MTSPTRRAHAVRRPRPRTCQWNRSSPAGPAEHEVGGSFCRSASSCGLIFFLVGKGLKKHAGGESEGERRGSARQCRRRGPRGERERENAIQSEATPAHTTRSRPRARPRPPRGPRARESARLTRRTGVLRAHCDQKREGRGRRGGRARSSPLAGREATAAPVATVPARFYPTRASHLADPLGRHGCCAEGGCVCALGSLGKEKEESAPRLSLFFALVTTLSNLDLKHKKKRKKRQRAATARARPWISHALPTLSLLSCLFPPPKPIPHQSHCVFLPPPSTSTLTRSHHPAFPKSTLRRAARVPRYTTASTALDSDHTPPTTAHTLVRKCRKGGRASTVVTRSGDSS